MKRMISILITIVLLFSVCMISANAQEATPDESQKEYLYHDRLIEWLGNKYIELDDDFPDYDELYFHYTDETKENFDWVLIRVVSGWDLCWYGKSGCNIGSRALYSYNGIYFPADLAIYDVKNDTFRKITEYREFDGVKEAVEELELGVALGDMDFDGMITIVDATHIQKILAHVEVRPRYSEEDDIIECGHYTVNDPERGPIGVTEYCYISDYDQDGKRTVLDATHIQKHLAGLE